MSLYSKTHPLFMKCAVMTQVQSVRYTCIQDCFLCFFSNPYISPFNSSFTCILWRYTAWGDMSIGSRCSKQQLLTQIHYQKTSTDLPTERIQCYCRPDIHIFTRYDFTSLKYSHRYTFCDWKGYTPTVELQVPLWMRYNKQLHSKRVVCHKHWYCYDIGLALIFMYIWARESIPCVLVKAQK